MDIAHVILDMYPNANWIIEGYDYEGLVWMSEDIPKPTREEVIARMDGMEMEQPMLLLRTHRNKLLAETDWSQGADVPEEIKTKYQSYRQELRDLPSTATPTLDTSSKIGISGVTWPTKPA
jgi:hypothetical protein